MSRSASPAPIYAGDTGGFPLERPLADAFGQAKPVRRRALPAEHGAATYMSRNTIPVSPASCEQVLREVPFLPVDVDATPIPRSAFQSKTHRADEPRHSCRGSLSAELYLLRPDIHHNVYSLHGRTPSRSPTLPRAHSVRYDPCKKRPRGQSVRSTPHRRLIRNQLRQNGVRHVCRGLPSTGLRPRGLTIHYYNIQPARPLETSHSK